jgi:protein MAK11
VNSISIHPTGRLALSVAQDGGLIMWDLTKGKPAYSTRLPGPAQRVAWFGGGSHFLVAYDACLAVHSGASGKLLHKCGGSDSTASVGAGVYGTSRICDVAVVSAEAATGVAGGRGSSAAAGESSEVLAYAVCGHESGEVSVWALPQGRQVRRFASGHTKRVRCVAFCDGRTGSPVKSAASAAGGSDGAAVGRSEPSSSLGDDVNPLSKLAAASKLRTVLPAGAGPYLVTADSDGLVKLWNAAEVLGEPAEAAGAGKDAAAPAALATLSAAAGSRITCLAASTHGPSTTAADDAAAGASIGSGSAAAVAAVAGASAGSAGGKPRKVGAKASRPGRHDGGKEAAAAAGAGGVAASTGRTSSPSSGGDGRAQKKQRRGSSAASGVAEATGAPAAAGAKPKPGGGGVRAPSVTVTSKKQRGGGAESAGPPAGGKAKKSVRFG